MLLKVRAGFPIFLAALNMRAGLVLMAPLLPIISKYYDLSTMEMSVLLSIPIIAFSSSSLIMGFLGRRASSDRIITAALVTLALGLTLRTFTGVVGLFLFTALIGISIAVMNYEVPVWVKVHLPESSGLATGIYVTLMGVGASVAVAISVPIAEATSFSWKLSMLPWIIFSTFAATYWIRKRQNIFIERTSDFAPFWRTSAIKNPVAWGLVFFFGLESMTFYGSASWLPSILITKGFELREAGVAIAFSGLLGSAIGIFFPHWISKFKDQRLLLAAVSALTGFSFFMMTVNHGSALIIWLCLSNIGISMAFPACLLLTSIKSQTPEMTRTLSTMMQSIGYVISATGPFYVSSFFERSGDWNIALYAICAISLLQLLVGLVVGKPSIVREAGTQH
jgi:CP family cyanate transporter-like MFS transporter